MSAIDPAETLKICSAASRSPDRGGRPSGSEVAAKETCLSLTKVVFGASDSIEKEEPDRDMITTKRKNPP